jgi:hypothetical protein
MDLEFLKEEKWPKLGNTAGEPAKKLHEWCGKISHFLLSLNGRVKLLENKEKENQTEIDKLKSDLEAAKKLAKPSNISNEWVQVVTKGAKNAKKPADQLTVANATINELQEREKRKKNVIIYGIPESTSATLTDKKADDELKIKEILRVIDKPDISPVYSRRLKSKDSNKPGPVLVELSDTSLRNPVLLAAKKLREVDEYKSVYISPDLTEAERQLDYKLRQERNKLNAELGPDSPFRYGIRGNQVQRFKKQQ